MLSSSKHYLLVALSLSLQVTSGLAGPSVLLGGTTIIGTSIPAFDQEFFGGIPFAEPPLGQLRFLPPVLKTSLDGKTFNASQFGPGCLQPDVPLSAVSEDCLSINILRPALQYNTELPVMLWFYGGGFFAGLSSSFNASAIVGQSVSRGTPVIFASFNYRLGPLGFPQGDEAAGRGALNLGLKDQLAALQWVQKNIGIFGGDKDKVTVFGESAGAISIAIHLLDPNFNTLARAAILESGSAATVPTFNSSRHQPSWQSFVDAVPSCADTANSSSTIPCLQSITNSTEFLQAFDATLPGQGNVSNALTWSPVLDGPSGVYPDLPSKLFKQGTFARLPFMAGTVLDEGTSFISPTSVNSSSELEEFIIATYSPSIFGPAALELAANELLDLYPDVPALGAPFGTGNNTFGFSSQYKRAAALVTDLSFVSQRRLWMQTASVVGMKTFGYLFIDPQPQNPPFIGVTHGSDNPYIFGTVNSTGTATVAVQALSEYIIEYWVSFVTSLDPNDGLGNQRPSWTQFTPSVQVILQLNSTNLTVIPDDFRSQQTDFINTNSSLWLH